MKSLLKIVVIVGLLGALGWGCGSFGLGTGSDTVTRVLADIGCLTALAGAGIQLSGDPTVSGATTVTGVVAAIGAIGASSVPSTVLAACKDTLAYAGDDMKGLVAFVKGTPGAAAEKVTPKSPLTMSVGKPAVPMKPTAVQVVLPKRP